MTYEFKTIIEAYLKADLLGENTVLATLVLVSGSSYRKEGVRMLVHQHGKIVGAISGGCVEKEIVHQSQSVFKTGLSKVINYDGRYRLGCEGILYILLEKLDISKKVILKLEKAFDERESFYLCSNYSLKENNLKGATKIKFKDETRYSLSTQLNLKEKYNHFFSQEMTPVFQLYAVGVEHDANVLCQQALLLGWEVVVLNATKTVKTIDDFRGVKAVINTAAGVVDGIKIDEQTAIVLMNHNYAKDLLFLKGLKKQKPLYIGLLGAKKRREQLFNALIEDDFDIEEEFLRIIYGPTGLSIGAETPQEIAVSIVSEIIAIVKKKETRFLQSKSVENNFTV